MIFFVFLFGSNSGKATQERSLEVYLFALVFVVLPIVSLIYVLRKSKKNKTIRVDYTDTLDINLTGKMLYKDYRNLMLKLTFKWKLFVVLIFICLSFGMVYGMKSDAVKYFIIFWGSLYFLSLIGVFIQTKKEYRTNNIFQQLNYKLTNDAIQITGETFNSVQKWTGFYKIKETKVFIMLYTGEGTAVLLDKKMFTTEELSNFKRFLCSLNLKQ